MKKPGSITVHAKSKTEISFAGSLKSENRLTKRKFLQLFILFMALSSIYLFNMNNGFVKWDDDWQIIDNPQVKNISVEKTGDIFTHFFKGQYSPVTTLATAMLHNGNNPKPLSYHLFSFMLHVINTALVLWLVFLLFSSYEMSFFVAAIFALHTLQVEAYAWASAVKVLLYTTFFLFSLIMYIKYVKRGMPKYILLSALFFLLSFLSKEQAVTISVNLIAIDFLLGRKLTDRKVILEKIPFLIISVIMGIVTIYSSRTGEFYDTGNSVPFYKQFAYASYALVHYIIKLVLPVNLSAFYPYPENRGDVPTLYWVAIIPALSVLALFIRAVYKNKTIAFGIAFFFINILLVMQLMPLRDFIAADRFVYLPLIGFFIIIAWIYQKFFNEKKKLQGLLKIIFTIYLVILLILSHDRYKVWKDSITLFDDMVKKVPESSVAWNNHGLTLYDLKKYQQSISDFNRSIKLNPASVFAYNNIGIAYTKTGDPKRAIQALDVAIKMRPDFMQAYFNRADAKSQLNDFAGSIADYDKIIELRPDYVEIYNMRGIAKAKSGNMKDALPDLNKAIELDPENPEAYMNRGVVKLNLADYNGAIRDFSFTILKKPGFAYSYFNRGLAFIKSGDTESGCNDLKHAQQLGFNQAAAVIKQYCSGK
jgi:tetratricopeptide (TPR) repeat protein